MIVSIRDGLKLIGVMLICGCAAFVCYLFLSYAAELKNIANEISSGPAQMIYDAQLATSKVIICVTGGCLVSTAIVVLCFYISHYLSAHSRQLGVLKALGWTRSEISRGFAVFGLSAFFGALVGCGAAVAEIPAFIETMNADHLLPNVSPSLHPELFIYVAAIPAGAFALFAVLYAAHRLRTPAITLMRGLPSASTSVKRLARDKDESFVASIRKSVMRTSHSLAFFVFIGAFCFACMMQMSSSMDELASDFMAGIMLVIGIILSVTCLLLSISSAVQRSLPTAAIMHANGYSTAECRRALLDGFRPAAYCGFVVGTAYQFALLRIIIDHFYQDYPNMPEYSFDAPLMWTCLGVFIILYEGGLVLASQRLTSVQIRVLASG